MPRFFFHIHDDLDCPDDEGTELPDLAAAEESATSEARLLMCDLLRREGRIALNHRIDIEDDEGGLLATVPFSKVVKIES
jgi:hypothetical protein